MSTIIHHKWTEAEKHTNCACCTLSKAMMTCNLCPFYNFSSRTNADLLKYYDR